ncbi:MAG: hypothetical protein KAJ95_03180, partial [Gammaproteobacteria bacterium]|nr:hypothetical protein [Gammaproteobacteria bacterium]
MEINLSVPPLSTDPVEFVQINPGTLASDLATLPREDFLYTGHRILNDLEQFNRASVDDELRLKLLDLYRVSILNLAKGLRSSIGKSNLPVNKKLLTKLNITLDLHQQLALGYKRILLNQDIAAASSLSENILIVSAERTVFSLLEIITLSYLSYTPIRENAWKEMHTLFHLAHKKGFSSVKIDDIADSSKHIKILDIYLFALLLGLSEPYGLPNGSLFALIPYFHIWIGYLSLFDKNNLEGLRYTYRIDADLDKPFLPFPEARPEGEIYVTTDALIHEMLGPNPPFDTSNKDNTEETFKLFRRSFFPKLITSWTNYPIRRYQRNSASGDVELLTGYEAAISMLKQGATVLSEKNKKHVQVWKVNNDSATGLGVEYHGHEVKSVNVGGLVLYRTEEMKSDNVWVTGIIRRFNQVGRSQLSMGLQRLPPDTHTGKLVRLAGGDKDSKLILMYPENPLLNSEATLIAPPGTFNPGAEFLVSLDNGREFKIRAIKTIQI